MPTWCLAHLRRDFSPYPSPETTTTKTHPQLFQLVARSHFLWEAAVRQLIMYMKIDDLVKLFEFSLEFQGPILSD